MAIERFVKAVSDGVSDSAINKEHGSPDLIFETNKFRTCTPTPSYFFSSESDFEKIFSNRKISKK